MRKTSRASWMSISMTSRRQCQRRHVLCRRCLLCCPRQVEAENQSQTQSQSHRLSRNPLVAAKQQHDYVAGLDKLYKSHSHFHSHSPTPKLPIVYSNCSPTPVSSIRANAPSSCPPQNATGVSQSSNPASSTQAMRVRVCPLFSERNSSWQTETAVDGWR